MPLQQVSSSVVNGTCFVELFANIVLERSVPERSFHGTVPLSSVPEHDRSGTARSRTMMFRNIILSRVPDRAAGVGDHQIPSLGRYLPF